MTKQTKKIISYTYLLVILFLIVRLFIISTNEVVNTENFTDYYEEGESANGGLELSNENFVTFVKEYNFIKKNKKIEKNKQLEKKKIQKKIEMLTYKIEAGDNLSKISKKLNISVDTLKIHNKSARKGRLIVNKKLVYPSKNGLFYKVKRGDSLFKISKKYGIKVQDILESNNVNPKKLIAGKKLFLPNVSYKEYKKFTAKKVQKKKKNQKKEKNVKKLKKSSLGFSFPIKYRGVNSRFGNRFHPVLKRYILHTGVDLVAKYVPLRAAKAGVVSYAGYMRGYGKIIIIKHANGYETRYAHLSVISTKVGEKVRRGEFIGKTGKSGRVTGPHLHFEIRYKGVPKNPMKYF